VLRFIPGSEWSSVLSLADVDARTPITFILKVSYVTSHFTLGRSLFPCVVVLLCLIGVDGSCLSQGGIYGVAKLLHFLVAIGHPVFGNKLSLLRLRVSYKFRDDHF